MPDTEVKAIQVSLCLRKSSTISGVQLSWKIILLIYELKLFLNLKDVVSSCSIFILVSEEESVSAVSSERASAQEDDEDGGPDHDAGQEPHEDDPDEGEDAGSHQSYANHVPSLMKIFKHRFS